MLIQNVEALAEACTPISGGAKYVLVQRGTIANQGTAGGSGIDVLLYIALGFHVGAHRDTVWYPVRLHRKFVAPKGKKIWTVFHKSSSATTSLSITILASDTEISLCPEYWNEFTADVSSARTASGAGQSVMLGVRTKVLVLVSVSAVSGTTPTLDIKLQVYHDPDGWADLYRINSQNASTDQLKLPQITATGVYALQFDFYGKFLRCYWTIGGTTPSFTFTTMVIAKGVVYGD